MKQVLGVKCRYRGLYIFVTALFYLIALSLLIPFFIQGAQPSGSWIYLSIFLFILALAIGLTVFTVQFCNMPQELIFLENDALCCHCNGRMMQIPLHEIERVNSKPFTNRYGMEFASGKLLIYCRSHSVLTVKYLENVDNVCATVHSILMARFYPQQGPQPPIPYGSYPPQQPNTGNDKNNTFH